MPERQHFMETGRDGIPIAVPVCRRVPSWASLTTDRAAVTCRWCQRWLERHPTEEVPDDRH